MDGSQLIFLFLLIGVFYFLLIRPQQRRARDHRQLISAINVGDEVVTIGGQFGRVTRQDDSTIWLEVADNVEIRFAKQAISRKVVPEPEESKEEAGEASADE
jgi:preprotein translocase subunit YajC